jgi:hypothetical protein
VGVAHYEGARLKGNGTTSDPTHTFKEAAASYVGHRAANCWMAFETLLIFIAAGTMARQLPVVRQTYNSAMSEVVFGYSEEGVVLGFGTSQAPPSSMYGHIGVRVQAPTHGGKVKTAPRFMISSRSRVSNVSMSTASGLAMPSRWTTGNMPRSVSATKA